VKSPAPRCETAGTARELTEIEAGISEDARRLEIATSAPRPISAAPVEELLADLRRIEAERKDKP